MDILKLISRIFKLEIILLLLLVVLFTLFNKQCMKKIMEHLENNEQCKPEEACKKVSDLQTKVTNLKNSYDKQTNTINNLKTENNKATEKINQLKKEATNTNSLNTQINANTAKIALLQTQLNTMKESHSKTAKAANEAKKGVDQMQGANKHMAGIFNK
tara:strand:- start:110 stop:586 length:477 start_codon:yes stop_codon:yes gene_type:complete